MGVPTVSLVGPAFFERLSFSNLVNAGLRDLAVDTPQAYVTAAVTLAADRERRRVLRAGLRADMRASAMGNTRAWVRDFEAATVRTLAGARPQGHRKPATDIELNSPVAPDEDFFDLASQRKWARGPLYEGVQQTIALLHGAVSLGIAEGALHRVPALSNHYPAAAGGTYGDA